MSLKKIFGKLAGGKEKQTESLARAPQQERGKKMKSYLTTKNKQEWGKNCTCLIVLLTCSFGERDKFTIEKLNSSRSALAEKGASDSEAHEFIARSVCGA